jgi:alpha-amylase
MADMVLNHRMGADYAEDTTGHKMDPDNRLQPIVEGKNLTVWTGFDFPGRNGKYSDFVWNKKHFSSVDWNQRTQKSKILKLDGHLFSRKVSHEHGNYDYLMGADVDYNVPEVVEEITRWGKWYLDFTGVDSLRLDAVKHISHALFPQWLEALRQHSGRELFAVGEYWMDNLYYLMKYLDDCDRCMSLFDVPLHHQFERAAKAGCGFDMRRIYENTLALHDPDHAVTLVDNHDTQPEQALQSWVQGWFKPLAYALILLREEGTPCVFYGDLYGIPHNHIPPVRELEALLLARKEYGFGEQKDYFDHPNVVGWTRGDHMAVVLSNGDDGWKDMSIGLPGDVYTDLLGNRQEEVVIREDGSGTFPVRSHSVSIWVLKK